MAGTRNSKKAAGASSTPLQAKIKSYRSPVLTRSKKIQDLLTKSDKAEEEEQEEDNEDDDDEEEEQEDNEDIALPSDSDDEDDVEDDDDEEEIKGFEESEEEDEESEKKETKSKKQKKGEETVSSKSGIHSVVRPKQSNTQVKSNDKSNKKTSKRGTIYIGRIPHGFHESEMRKYFQQFGDITRLRLSRNKKTGNSKHYGFIEFADLETAKVAAETMNNYLIFGHLLKVSVLPQESQHDELFNGSNTKYKSIPWSKISQFKNDAPKSAEKWGKIVKKNKSKNAKKQETLKSKGINYDINALLKK